MGCVTGVANIFPKSVSKLCALWQEGKVDEAVKLQGQVAQAEKACKEGLAGLKFGTAHFAGPSAGITNLEAFYPRKPYKPAGKDMQTWVIESMKILVDFENSLPDVHTSQKSKLNGH